MWGDLAPRTWNRHVATVRSFTSGAATHGWPAGDLYLAAHRRTVAADDTKAIPLPQLERLWKNCDIPPRERALWRLLYDSAARAEEAQAWTRPTSTSPTGRARARVKGGDTPTSCTSRPPPPGSWRG